MSDDRDLSSIEINENSASVDQILDHLPAQKLLEIIHSVMNENAGAKRHILNWFKTHSEGLPAGQLSRINDELLWEYWEKVEPMIVKFNEYGGGSDRKFEQAHEWLEKIHELVQNDPLSTAGKIDFMDEVFYENAKGNSEFDYKIMEIIFDLCKTREEWESLVDHLQKKPTDWRNKLTMDVWKDHLHEDEKYLAMRQKHLVYGMDYWDLVSFYKGKGDISNAVAVAEKGLAIGEGRIDELSNFLKDHYQRLGDSANLERIHELINARDRPPPRSVSAAPRKKAKSAIKKRAP